MDRYTAGVRVLAVDLGSKRIGLAVSDEGARLAFPAGVIESRGRKRDLAALKALIREREIVRAVVGVPVHMSGRRGPEADAALRFAEDLARATGVPVDTLDERWTSVEAERILRTTDRGRRAVKQRAGAVDEMAAAILLQTYLELSPIRAADRPTDRPDADPLAQEKRPVDEADRQSDGD